MSATARRISVVVDGESASAQEALAKAVDAMVLLGDAAVEQADRIATSDAKIVEANDLVIDSYDRMLTSITRSVDGIDVAFKTQITGQENVAKSASAASQTVITETERQAAAVTSSTGTIDAAVGSQIDRLGQMGDAVDSLTTDVVGAAQTQDAAIRTSTGVFDEAAKAQVAGWERVAEAANASADGVVRAATRQSAATSTSAGEQIAAQKRVGESAVSSATKSNAAFNVTGTGLSKLGKTTALALTGIAGASIYMAAHYEASTTRLLTQAGASTREIGTMRKSLLDMAGEVGQTPEHLSTSFYHVVSAMEAVLPPAHRTTEELQIQKVAAEGAAVGHTQLEETTYALSSAMNALHVNAGQAEHTMGTLNAIVGAGDMTMEDLLAAMKSGLIPTARSFGIDLESVGSALAVMGDQGMRGALAGTRLRMSIALLAAPSAKAAEMLKAIGLSSGEIHARTTAMSQALEAAGLSTTKMAEDLRKPNGLAIAFHTLDAGLKNSGLSATQTAALLSRAFGGGRMGSTIMLLSQSVDRLDAKYKQIHDTTGQFGDDWAKTQHTLAFQTKEFEGDVTSLGVNIGTALIPKAEELVGTLKEVFDWFEENKGAAHALEYTIGGVLATAVGVYAVGSFVKLINVMKLAYTEYGKLQTFFRQGFSRTVTPAIGEQITAGGAAAGEEIAASMITAGGVVSAELRGAMTQGGMAAAGEEIIAAKTGIPAFGGGVLTRDPVTGQFAGSAPKYMPSQIYTAANPEAEIATTSAASSIKGAIGGLMANAMKGGMYALLGTVASQAAGSAIGGKTGKDVASIGSGAAIGAGIGTMIAPGLGTAIGAGLGSVPGIVKALEGPSVVDQAAKNAPTGLPHYGDIQTKALEESVKHIRQREHEELSQLKPVHFSSNPYEKESEARARGTYKTPRNASEERQAETIKNTAGIHEGQAIGGQEASYIKSGAVLTNIQSIISTTEAKFKKLSPAARDGMFGAMMQMVKTLEHDGRLPVGAAQKFLDAIHNKFGAMGGISRQAAATTVAEWNLMQKGGAALSSADAFVGHILGAQKQIPLGAKTTSQETGHFFTAAENELLNIVKNSTGKRHQLALQAYNTLRGMDASYYKNLHAETAAQLSSINSTVRTLSSKGRSAFLNEWQGIEGPLKKLWEEGFITTETYIKKMAAVTEGELTALGVKPNKAGKQSAKFGPGPGSGNGLVSGLPEGVSGSPFGAAQGGLIQVGKAGEKGRDSVPFMAGGVPIVTAPGEQIAVFTHQQQAIANQKMADIGGLPGLFAKNKTPHHMESGGFVPFASGGEVTTGSHYSKPQLETIWKRDNAGIGNPHLMAAIALAESAGDPGNIGPPTSGGRAEGLWQIMMPVNATYVHGSVFNPDVNAKAAGAILRAQGLGAWETYTNGAYQRFLGAKGGAGGDMASTATFKKIVPPKWTGPGGQIGAMGQAAVASVAHAANELLKREATNTSTAGATGGGGGAVSSTPSGVAGLGKFGGLPVANWIIPELIYAQQHGWHGGISSGWRSPTEVIHSTVVAPQGHSEHQGTQWPHGAVDFGSPSEGANREAFERATVGYKGHRLIKATGFVDEGHMSGTGHEYGGFVNAFEEGGMVPLMFASGGKANPKEIKEKEEAEKRKKKPQNNKQIPPNQHNPSHPKLTKHSVAEALAPLALLPDVEHLPPLFDEYVKHIADIEAQASLMQQIESTNKQDTFVLPGDMNYIGAMNKYANIQPGMTIAQAMNVNESALTRNKQIVAGKGKGKATIPQEEEAEALEYQAQFLEWATAQASHRLLTGSDAGLLAGTKAGVGWSPPAGQNLWRAELTNAELKVNQLGGEENAANKGISLINMAIGERHRRQKMVDEVMAKEEYRLNLTKGHIEGLTQGSLKHRVSEAENKENYRVRQEAAHQSVAQIQESIDNEKAAAKPDKKLISELEKQKHGVSAALGSGKAATGKVKAAQVAKLEHELKGQITPIHEALSQLGGESNKPSHKGGEYGKLTQDIKKLRDSSGGYSDAIGKIQASDLPMAKLAELAIEEAAKDSPVPPFIPNTHEAETETDEAANRLDELDKQQIEILGKNFAVSQAQYATITNFQNTTKLEQGGVVIPVDDLPHFDTGGPVLKDGPAVLHEGEHVVPKDGTLVSTGGSNDVSLHHTTVVQGDMAALINIIDSRVTHPQNVRLVSRQMQQRTGSIPVVRR